MVGPALRLQLASDRTALEPARLAVLDFLAPFSPSARTVYAIELVLEEVLTNEIKYAFDDHAEHPIDLTVRLEPDALQTLRFSWRVNSLIDRADVRRRETEDSPARIVLAFDGDHGALPLKDRSLFELAELVTGERPPYATLMYVWDNGAPLESVVINPRSDRIRKIVVESGPEHLRQWREHERDIAGDYRRAFGEAPGALIGIGLMTDADNTGTSATAWYGAVCLSGVQLSSASN